MRVVVQRVHEAMVSVESVEKGRIGAGLLVFAGVEQGDTMEDICWMARKISQLRVFEDEEERMNRSVLDIGGGILVISQFTLLGNVRKGTRPSFNHAAPPSEAVPLYESFLAELESALGKAVPRGMFGHYMRILADNDGPVTLIIDSRTRG
ncbi:MAG: D-tyrosyl-tRNA(Tyr) deacylase [Opitutales bacterium]|nr:D-tyrosyl-tRNA(Tyr) deacylase [Opitutales bacterium]